MIYLLLLVFAFFVLLPSWLHYDIISMDGAFQYIPVAKLFAAGSLGEALSQFQMPLFPALIASVANFVAGDFELAGRLVAVIGFMLLLCGVFALTFALFDRRLTALLAVVFTACTPILLKSSVDCLKESVFLALLVWGTLFVLRAINGSGRTRFCWGVLAGVFLLLATLLRSMALFVVVAWMLSGIIYAPLQRRHKVMIILTPLLLALLCALIFPALLTVERKGFYLAPLIAIYPGTAKLLLNALGVLGQILLLGNPLVLLLAIRVLLGREYSRYYVYSLGLIVLTLPIFALLGDWVSGRYLLMVVVGLYPIAANVAVKFMDAGSRRGIVVAIVLVSCLGAWLYQSTRLPNADYLDRRAAGIWLKEQDCSVIMTNRPRIAFYAGAEVLEWDVAALNSSCVAVDLSLMGEKPDRPAAASFGSINIYMPGKEIEDRKESDD